MEQTDSRVNEGKSEEEEVKEENQTKDSNFECNICLDFIREPVVTYCGHLYCWPCIFAWIEHGEKPCPVCKSAVSKEKLIPIYGKENKNQVDPRTQIPDRPVGQRTEPTAQPNQHMFQVNAMVDGFSLVGGSGVGLFPLLMSSFTQPYGSAPPGAQSLEEDRQSALPRLFMACGMALVLLLLM